MAMQTSDRALRRDGVEPCGYRTGTPDTKQFYFGQLIAQVVTTGVFTPVTSSLVGGITCVGVCERPAFNVTATTPLPEILLTVKYGTFEFSNSGTHPVTTGSLMNTLLFADDDNTLGVAAAFSGATPVGRLRGFNPLNQYPVLAEVGLIVSGTTV